MSKSWAWVGGLLPTALLKAGQVACYIVVTLAVTMAPADAQETPIPTAQSYLGASQAQAYQGAFADLANEIDDFWADFFRDAQLPYRSPGLVPVDRVLQTECGLMAPEPNASYCPADQTIYLVPEFLVDQERDHGDYAPIAILSHEWGHHVQSLLRIIGPTPKAFELQADCLMGVFTRHADEQGLLDYGDFLEALAAAEAAGDEGLLPEDAPGAHGRPEERVKALTLGFGGGPISGCELPVTEIIVVDEDSEPGSEWLLALLPELPPLSHGSCFGIVADGAEDFAQVLTRFSGVPDAADRLQDWGWQGSAFRKFGCDGPPEGEAGWVDISVHLFADAVAAQEAVDFFTAVRLEGSPYMQGASPGIGDHSTAMSGPAVNGKDFTVYASQGPLLIRVTGVSPSGIPFGNVLAVARAVLAAQYDPSQQSTVSAPPDLRASAYLPASLAVNYAECFQTLTEGSYSSVDVASALWTWGLSEADINELGWQDGAYRVFTCASPPFGRAAQIEVIIHRFRDGESTQRAAPYIAGTQGLGENETRSCDTAGSLVICVFGRSLTGSPLSDVAFVLQQVITAAR